MSASLPGLGRLSTWWRPPSGSGCPGPTVWDLLPAEHWRRGCRSTSTSDGGTWCVRGRRRAHRLALEQAAEGRPGARRLLVEPVSDPRAGGLAAPGRLRARPAGTRTSTPTPAWWSSPRGTGASQRGRADDQSPGANRTRVDDRASAMQPPPVRRGGVRPHRRRSRGASRRAFVGGGQFGQGV